MSQRGGEAATIPASHKFFRHLVCPSLSSQHLQKAKVLRYWVMILRGFLLAAAARGCVPRQSSSCSGSTPCCHGPLPGLSSQRTPPPPCEWHHHLSVRYVCPFLPRTVPYPKLWNKHILNEKTDSSAFQTDRYPYGSSCIKTRETAFSPFMMGTVF